MAQKMDYLFSFLRGSEDLQGFLQFYKHSNTVPSLPDLLYLKSKFERFQNHILKKCDQWIPLFWNAG